MTIKRLNELFKDHSRYRSLNMTFAGTCGYCGRQNKVKVIDRTGNYIVQCPKWMSLWGWLRGKGELHYMDPTGIPVYDKNGDFLE